MKEYVDEMLRLASDIVEGLLTVKDNDADVDPQLNLLIQQLAVISDRHTVAAHNTVPASEAESLMEEEVSAAEAEAKTEAECRDLSETDAYVEPEEPAASDAELTAESARFEELSDAGVVADSDEDSGTDADIEVSDACVAASEDAVIAENAEAEETADADVPDAAAGTVAVGEVTVEEIPDEPAPVSEVPVQESPVVEVPVLEVSGQDSPVEETPSEEPVQEAPSEGEAVSADDMDVDSRPDAGADEVSEQEELAEECARAEEPVRDETPTPVPSDGCGVSFADLRRAFSLNDIFLYRRTLFGGSSSRFDGTLRAVTCMKHIDELRRYLAEVEGVNVKSAAAKEFMSVLSVFLED